MIVDRSNVTDDREDISRFVVHLTRDELPGDKVLDEITNARSARDRFISIFNDREIKASNAHCIHKDKLDAASDEVRAAFRVSCFTEVPLTQIHLLTQKIVGRRIRLAAFGFVFTRKFLMRCGAQPALYINSYRGSSVLRDAVDRIYEVANKAEFRGKIWRILPYVKCNA